ncbi:MAG: hypothetical protein AB7O96_04020 [Pseudobdellovibrionaceae bacterium]
MKKFLLLISFLALGSAAVASEQVATNLNVDFQSKQADAPLAIEPEVDPQAYYYYDWGRGRNGWGYCYMWDRYGRVRNGGYPVSNYNCERVRPSYFRWARSRNGYYYCYQYTPYGVIMNEGYPVSNYYCN